MRLGLFPLLAFLSAAPASATAPPLDDAGPAEGAHQRPGDDDRLERLARAIVAQYKLLIEDLRTQFEKGSTPLVALGSGLDREPARIDERGRARLNDLIDRYLSLRARLLPDEREPPADAFFRIDSAYFNSVRRWAQDMLYGDADNLGIEGQARDVEDNSPLFWHLNWQRQAVYLVQRVAGRAEASRYFTGGPLEFHLQKR